MQKGLTLTELLVSVILIGIVMTGVAAFSVFVKQARDSTSEGTILAMRTATAMHYIKEDALGAIGDSSDRGVVGAAPELICFRYDDSDPTVYTDDKWACYWYDDEASYALWKCADQDELTFILPVSLADCQTGTGEVELVTLDPAATGYFEIVDDANGRLAYIDITLNTIADPGPAPNTITNPTYRLFTRVSPPVHGR